MTANQINYQKNLETNRHNVQDEAIRSEANRLTGQANRIRLAELGESSRHNKETERQGAIDVGTRAFMADTGRQQMGLNYELGLGNIGLGYYNADIAADRIALGYAQLDEARRHNIVGEGLTDEQIMNQWLLGQAENRIRQGQLAESARHNQATEAETHRSNTVNETMRGTEAATKVAHEIGDWTDRITKIINGGRTYGQTRLW